MEMTKIILGKFGLTDNPSDAGFILPNGKLINLSRSKKENKIYHHQVLSLFGMKESSDNLIDLIKKERLVRFCSQGMIHIENKPTEEQLKKIALLTKYRSYEFEIIAQDSISRMLNPKIKDLRQLTSHIPYYGDEILVREDKTRIVLLDGEYLKVMGLYLKRTEKLFFSGNYLKKKMKGEDKLKRYLNVL